MKEREKERKRGDRWALVFVHINQLMLDDLRNILTYMN